MRDLRASMHTQADILSDLHDITDDVTCRPVTVPNHRPVPHVALWTGIPPGEIVSAQLEQPTPRRLHRPRERARRRNFTLDKNDPKRLTATVPPGFRGGEQRLLAPLRAADPTRRECAGARRPARSACEPLPARKWTVHPMSKSASRDGHLTDSGRATPLRPPVTA